MQGLFEFHRWVGKFGFRSGEQQYGFHKYFLSVAASDSEHSDSANGYFESESLVGDRDFELEQVVLVEVCLPSLG